MQYIHHRFFILPLLLAASLTTFAQLGGEFSIQSGYDDNPLRNEAASSQFITQAGFMLGYFPENQDWGISYSGGYTYYSAYPASRYANHSIAGAYILSLNAEQSNSLSLQASGTARYGATVGDAYNYYRAIASVGLKYFLDETTVARASYRIRFQEYPNFYSLAYLEHYASVSLNRSFETRTSVTLQADLGNKLYQDLAVPSVSTTTTTTSTGTGSSGNGKGGNGKGNGQNGTSSGEIHGTTTPELSYLSYDSPNAAQLVLKLTIGQALSETTGMSAGYVQRMNLNDRGGSVTVGGVTFLGDEDIFDDPYSFESKGATLRLTQLLPWTMRLRVSSEYHFKKYSSPAVATTEDLASDVLRNDRQFISSIELGKSFDNNWLFFDGLHLVLGYAYIRNLSNAETYDYHNSSLILGFSTDF